MQRIKKPLNFFAVAMMSIVMVASLQMMTACAIYGASLIFFYIIAALLFFFPCLFLVKELAAFSPVTGGAYIWVERAFGKKWGFVAASIQWLSNLIWYPTIFSFIATAFAYLVFPQWALLKSYLFISMLILFWAITLINFFGIKVSSLIGSISAVIGVILPTAVLIVFGCIWIMQSHPIHMQFNLEAIIPHLNEPSQFAFLTQVVISLVGREGTLVHAGDIEEPHRTIPKALKLSAIGVLFIVITAPLAIAAVIPAYDVNLVAGLFDAFKIFFDQCGISSTIFLVMLGLVFIGNCGHVTGWMISATRSMYVASMGCSMPLFMQKTNRFEAPKRILIIEAIIFSILACFFLFFETIHNAYWILLILACQMTLCYYLFIFAAAVKIKKSVSKESIFIFLCTNWRTVIAALFAGVAVIAAMVCGFLPPDQGMVIGGKAFPFLIAAGFIIFLSLPFMILKLGKSITFTPRIT